MIILLLKNVVLSMLSMRISVEINLHVLVKLCVLPISFQFWKLSKVTITTSCRVKHFLTNVLVIWWLPLITSNTLMTCVLTSRLSKDVLVVVR